MLPPPPPHHQPHTPLPLLTPPQVIRGKQVEVPKAYAKGVEGRLVNDQRFIDKPNQYLVKDICDACAQNTNPRAMPKSSNTKSDLIDNSKRVFANFL